MSYFRYDDCGTGRGDGSEPGEATHNLRFTRRANDQAEGPAVEQNHPRHD
jgi:hypothetical protein